MQININLDSNIQDYLNISNTNNYVLYGNINKLKTIFEELDAYCNSKDFIRIKNEKVNVNKIEFNRNHIINILDKDVYNKIAAGEVVEKPASVVKELVENSIDAGSSQITIEIEESGLKKIQVTDNGEGIAQEDVALSLHRHATSKIKSQADLFRIRTLGFRGEALASIASVSHLTLITKTEVQDFAIEIQLSGGERRRCEIARALAIDPKFILLDEPFAALNEELRAELSMALRERIKQSGASAILVTHQRADAEGMADKILHLETK